MAREIVQTVNRTDRALALPGGQGRGRIAFADPTESEAGVSWRGWLALFRRRENGWDAVQPSAGGRAREIGLVGLRPGWMID